MELVVLLLLIALIPATIAQRKGKSFFGWWIYGILLFIVALIHSLVMKPDTQALEKKKISEGMKKCPYCAEMIKAEASVCRYCSSSLVPKRSQHSSASAPVGRAEVALANEILFRWESLDDVSRQALAARLLTKIDPNFGTLSLTASELKRLVTDVATGRT